jgi:hypothetical protein
MEPTSPTTLLICGQLRDPVCTQLVFSGAKKLLDAKQVDEVIISTWPEDRAGNPVNVGWIEGLGFRVVVCRQPPQPFGGSHNCILQSKQMYQGLRAAAPGAWVFKTRTDILLNFERLPALFERVRALPPVDEPRRVFSRRVWLPHFEATQPFNLADMVQFGLAEDLLKLCNFDFYYEVNDAIPDNYEIMAATAEIRRFMPAFYDHFPILREYRDAWQFASYETPQRYDVMLYCLNNPIYWEYMTLSLYIIHNYFAVGKPFYDGMVHVVRNMQPTADPGKFDIVGFPFFHHVIKTDWFLKNFTELKPHSLQLYCGENSWVEDLFAKRIDDPLVKEGGYFWLRLQAALEWRDDAARRQAFAAYREGLRKVAATPDGALQLRP